MEDILRQYKKRRRYHRRLVWQSKVMSVFNRSAFFVLVLLICVASHVFYLGEYKILADKELLLSEARFVEESARQDKDRVMRQNRALQEDANYIELEARDTLDYYKPGEIIFEVDRSGREAGNELDLHDR